MWGKGCGFLVVVGDTWTSFFISLTWLIDGICVQLVLLDEFSLLSCSVFYFFISFFLSISFDLIRCAAILSMWVFNLPCFVVWPFALSFSFHLNSLCKKRTTHSWIDATHTYTLPSSHLEFADLNGSDIFWPQMLLLLLLLSSHCTSLGLTKAPPTWIFLILLFKTWLPLF